MGEDKFKLVPWTELSHEALNTIITNEAKDNSGHYIDPNKYTNYSFYTDKDGNLAKGTDVDNWRKWSSKSKRYEMLKEDPNYFENLWKVIDLGILEIPVFSSKRTKMLQMHPYATSLAGSGAEGIGEFIDVNLPGVSKVTSPSWWLGNIGQGYVENPLDYNKRNNGIFEFAPLLLYSNEWWAPWANLGVDLGTGYGGARFIKWGTTPKVINGTEATISSRPFSPFVEKIIYDPEYLEFKNGLQSSRLLKPKLTGTTIDGYPKYRLLKVIPFKKAGNGIRRGFAKDNFYPTEIEGYDETLAFNPMEKIFIGDLDGNTGWSPFLPFRGEVAFDWSALRPVELMALAQSWKKGGKLIPRKFKSGGSIRKFGDGGETEKFNWFLKLIRPYTWNAQEFSKEEFPTLKDALFAAKSSGLTDKDVIKYNGDYYKVALSDDDLWVYRNWLSSQSPNYSTWSNNGNKSSKTDTRDWYLSNLETSLKTVGYNPNFKETIDPYINPLAYLYNYSRHRLYKALEKLNSYEYNDPLHELENSNILVMSDLKDPELSKIKIPKHVIQAIVNSLDNENEIWDTLAIPMKEFRYGQGTGNDKLSDREGYIRMIYNNHGYENENFAMSNIGELYRSALKNLKRTIPSWKKQNATFGLLLNLEQEDPELWNEMTRLAKDWMKFHNKELTKKMDAPHLNFFRDALTRLYKGTYNPEESGYKESVYKFRDKMKQSKILTNYVNELIRLKKTKSMKIGGKLIRRNIPFYKLGNKIVVAQQGTTLDLIKNYFTKKNGQLKPEQIQLLEKLWNTRNGRKLLENSWNNYWKDDFLNTYSDLFELTPIKEQEDLKESEMWTGPDYTASIEGDNIKLRFIKLEPVTVKPNVVYSQYGPYASGYKYGPEVGPYASGYRFTPEVINLYDPAKSSARKPSSYYEKAGGTYKPYKTTMTSYTSGRTGLTNGTVTERYKASQFYKNLLKGM